MALENITDSNRKYVLEEIVQPETNPIQKGQVLLSTQEDPTKWLLPNERNRKDAGKIISKRITDFEKEVVDGITYFLTNFANFTEDYAKKIVPVMISSKENLSQWSGHFGDYIKQVTQSFTDEDKAKIGNDYTDSVLAQYA